MTSRGDAIVRIDGGSSTLWGRRDRGAWDVRIDVHDTELCDDGLDEAEWARRCAANPRLFNGPMLSAERIDPEAGTISARRGWYKQLVLGMPGVRLLAVMGVVVARRERGELCTLIGKRSHNTRLYGGRWELAPAGGLDPVPERRVTRAMMLRQLAEETREELGIEAKARSADVIALVQNGESRSVDVVVRVEPEASVEALRARLPDRASWEYERLLWLPLSRADGFVARRRGRMTPQSRVVFEYLGWTGRSSTAAWPITRSAGPTRSRGL